MMVAHKPSATIVTPDLPGIPHCKIDTECVPVSVVVGTEGAYAPVPSHLKFFGISTKYHVIHELPFPA